MAAVDGDGGGSERSSFRVLTCTDSDPTVSLQRAATDEHADAMLTGMACGKPDALLNIADWQMQKQRLSQACRCWRQVSYLPHEGLLLTVLMV